MSQLPPPDARLHVEIARQSVGRKALWRNVRDELSGVNEDGMTASRILDRHATLNEALAQVVDLPNPIVQILLF